MLSDGVHLDLLKRIQYFSKKFHINIEGDVYIFFQLNVLHSFCLQLVNGMNVQLKLKT